MAKAPSPFLQGASGKFAGAVLQGSAGKTTILRANVKPKNPQTQKQVNQRAKFKLLNQLASLLVPYSPLKQQGELSPANQFVKINSSIPVVSNGVASCDYRKLQLTNSNLAPIEFYITRIDNQVLAEVRNDQGYEAICYIAFTEKNGILTYVGSAIETLPNNILEGKVFSIDQDSYALVFAYGIKTKDGSAETIFNELQVSTANNIANIMAKKLVADGDLIFTKSLAGSLQPNSDEAEWPDESAPSYPSVTVNLSADVNGMVGFGSTSDHSTTKSQAFSLGATVTADAVANSSYIFAWWEDENEVTISTDANYQFVVQEYKTYNLKAIFQQDRP